MQKTNDGIKSLAKIYIIFTPVILSGFNCSFGCTKHKKRGKNCLLAQRCTGQNPDMKKTPHVLQNQEELLTSVEDQKNNRIFPSKHSNHSSSALLHEHGHNKSSPTAVCAGYLEKKVSSTA